MYDDNFPIVRKVVIKPHLKVTITTSTSVQKIRTYPSGRTTVSRTKTRTVKEKEYSVVVLMGETKHPDRPLQREEYVFKTKEECQSFKVGYMPPNHLWR